MAETRTDRELIGAVGARQDAAAFEELVRRWDRRLVTFFAKASGERQLAYDLRQETFLRVWRGAGTYDKAYAASTWIVRIATNVLRTEYARNKRWSIDLSRDGWENEESISRISDGEISITLSGVIDSLALHDRELLLLRFQLELPYSEIALIFERPESTVKSRMAALLRRLRVRLELAGIHKGDY